MGRVLCKLCESGDYDLQSVKVAGDVTHTLRHECFPDSEDLSNVLLLRGPSPSHCKAQWRELMIKRVKTQNPRPVSDSETHDLLMKWTDAQGKDWIEHIRDRAAAGYTWKDVADDFGMKRERVRNFCCRRGYYFKWSGKNSPRNEVKRGHYKQYTAFGVTETLPKLVEQFGEPNGLTYSMVHRRMFKRKVPMDIEDALTKPSQKR